MELYEFTFNAMTTPCKVKLYTDSEAAASVCFEDIKKNTLRLEKKYNFFDPKSYLHREINTRKRNVVKLDKETLNVLTQVRILSEATDGTFDITVGTLKSCYKHNTLEEVEACLKNKRPFTGLEAWWIKDKKLHTKDKQTLFDLGGVIKEFAVDEASKIAKKHKIPTALINYGGDIFVYGHKPGDEHFFIGIKNPKNPKENIAILPLDNQALTTSANYERNREIEGIAFSHIIGANTNQAGIISSTIISNSVLVSGVYSTVFMLEMDITIPDGIGVMLVDRDMKIHQNLMQKN